MNRNAVGAGFGLVCAGLLAGCGGGGGGSSSGGNIVGPASGSPADAMRMTAEGLWAGTTFDNRDVTLLVLDNGVFWAHYTTSPGGGPFGPAPKQPSGLMMGSGTSTAGDPQGSYAGSGRDFNFGEGIGQNDITISARYVPVQTIDGTTTYPAFNGMVSFSLVQTGGYEDAADLRDISGTYTGQGRPVNVATGDFEDVTLRVTSSGTISGLTQTTQCSFAGVVAPRARGNVFDITVQFNGATCADSLASVRGVAFNSGTAGTLTAFALNSARDDGFIFSGTRTAP